MTDWDQLAASLAPIATERDPALSAFPVNPGTGADPIRARSMDARVITLSLRHGSSVAIGV